MLLFLVCLLGSLSEATDTPGFGGVTAADYLEDDISVFLGAELYAKAYKVQDDEQKFDDVMMDAISDAFALADTDKNGTLSKEELTSHMGRNKYDLLNKPLLKKFHSLDQDNSGDVTWREYFAKSFSPDFVDGVNRGFVDIEVLANVKTEYEHFTAHYHLKRFNTADKDRSDSLSHSEFIMFMRPQEFLEMRDVYLEELLQDLKNDEDDENVSHEEYMQHVQGIAISNRPEDIDDYLAREEEKFKKFDVDKNNKLNITETKEWLFGYINTKDHGHLVKDEVVDYFKVIDKNKDGVLAFEEVIAASEYIFHGEEPQTFESMGLMNNTNATGDPVDIWPLLTPEAIVRLEKELDENADPLSKIDGLAPEVRESESEFLEYEPDFDPDNARYRWGFVKETFFRKADDMDISQWMYEVKERNGFF